MTVSAAQVRSVRKYAAATVLSLIAAFQVVRVWSGSHSSWRGGGFGMYADFHPNMRRFWLKSQNGAYTPIPRETTDYKRCANLGSAACLRDATFRRDPSHTLSGRIELWAPRFDTWTGELGTTRLNGEHGLE